MFIVGGLGGDLVLGCLVLEILLMGMSGILPKTADKVLGYVEDSFCMFSAASDGCEIGVG